MTSRPSSTDPWTLVFLLSGLGHLANGLWMLAGPAHWYAALPAGVPDFGPLNEHFVRDLGSTFAMLGLALVWGAARLEVRVPVLVLVTLFNALHALVHVWDTSRGLVGPEHWAIDFPVVYLPTVVLIALTALLVRRTEARA
ncbi:MAG: hypothetical protein IT294_11790 [Deltaproteobacteria bacterium]|nr:hypothetical protein [Deltaproteobacteria bacterium]